jgi:sporulation protein YlmC with PRC-barrel domain
MRRSDDSLRGKHVITADGKAIGTIVGLFIDETKWHVDSVHVQLRKDVADRIGMRRSMFRSIGLELPIQLIQSVGDTVVLGVGLDELRHVHRPAPVPDRPEAR